MASAIESSATELGTTNTQAPGLRCIVDRNTVVWWALILISVSLAVFVTPWGGLFWFVALAVDDISMYVFGKPLLFDSQLRVRRNYQWMHNMYDNTTGSGRDLGFNLVVDGQLSQRAKYEYMGKQLGLERGMAICDVGCGYGDWLKYCRDELGCTAVGINITPEQAEYARDKYGLEVHITNWKDILTDPELQKQLYGRFDAVTFMDTVEHYVSMEDRRNWDKQKQIYSDMCYMTSQLMNPQSKAKTVFLSCLHQVHRPLTWKAYYHVYFMDKFYSGFYPFTDEGPMRECAPWFDVVQVDDKTEDYRLTGVKDRKHFQAVRVKVTPKKVGYVALMFFLDPYVLHRLIYYTQDSWMFLYGENAYSLEYDAEYRKRVTYVLLFWITLRMKAGPTINGPMS
jgi:cyclopropane fatty-acyl-phospholipid synthase-like methyltransferase